MAVVNRSNSEVGLITLVSATGIGVFMGALDGSVVNISLHNISDWFNVEQSAVQWVVLAYLLTVIATMTISGNLGDKFSTKKVFQGGILMFITGSFFCGISQSLEFLVLSRIFQALGATGLFANGIAIITRFTTRKNRGIAIGINSLIVSGALASGPVLGGILTQYFGWQSIFLINLPIGLIGFFWVQKAIPPTPPIEKKSGLEQIGKKLDYWGILLFPLTLITFIFAVSLLNNDDILVILPIVFLLIAISIILGYFLIIVEKKSPNPSIDLTLFQNKKFFSGIFSAVFAFTGLQVILYQIPFFLQDKMTIGFTESTTSLIIIPVPIFMALSGPIAGYFSDRVDAQYLATAGMIGIGIVLFFLAIIISTSLNIILLLILMVGFGLTIGFFATPNGNSVMSNSPKEKLGLAGGLLGLSRNIGFALGITLSTTALTLLRRLLSVINNTTLNNPDTYASALQIMFLLSIPFLILAAIVSYYRGPEIRAEKNVSS